MQVVIVLFGIGQLLLKLNLSSSQNIFLVPGFIPLVEHMNKHALTIPVSNCQALQLLMQVTDIRHYHLIPMDGLVPLLSHLCQLSLQPLDLPIMVML
jgi:hypothetical protein